MKARSLAPLLAALVACRRPSPDSSTSSPGPSASAAPLALAPLTPGRLLVVWARLSGGSGYESFLVSSDGSLSGSIPGLQVPVSGQWGTLTLTTTGRPVGACPAGSVPFAHPVRHDLSLVFVDRTRSLVLPGDGASERQLLILGLVGDRLFVRVAELLDACSDPPRYRVSVVEVSLVYGTSTLLASDDTPGAPAALREVDRVRAALAVALSSVPRDRLPAGVTIEGGAEQAR